MILIKPSYEIMSPVPDNTYTSLAPELIIEKAGRVCYKSEAHISPISSDRFIKKIIKNGHESVLEHSSMTVKFIIDRGVSHELVRHRLASFSQESTRYCNYKGGVTFVIPPWVEAAPGEYPEYPEEDELLGPFNDPGDATDVWLLAMKSAEDNYLELVNKYGWSPQQARSVLPNSLKTELIMTANFREWRHVFKLRAASAAHPQMQEIMFPLLRECVGRWPAVFGDLEWNED